MVSHASHQVPSVSADPFRAVFDQNVSYVVTSLARMGVSAADREDLASEVFVRVYRDFSTYDPARPIRPWLFAFVARVASEHRRKAHIRREVFGIPESLESMQDSPERALVRARDRASVLEALDVLDLDKRAVFVMHELDSTPIPEIARTLQIPEGTAYTRLRAARQLFSSEIKRSHKETSA